MKKLFENWRKYVLKEQEEDQWLNKIFELLQGQGGGEGLMAKSFFDSIFTGEERFALSEKLFFKLYDVIDGIWEEADEWLGDNYPGRLDSLARGNLGYFGQLTSTGPGHEKAMDFVNRVLNITNNILEFIGLDTKTKEVEVHDPSSGKQFRYSISIFNRFKHDPLFPHLLFELSSVRGNTSLIAPRRTTVNNWQDAFEVISGKPGAGTTTIYMFGKFKPPHKNHMEMLKHYIKIAQGLSEKIHVYILVSQKTYYLPGSVHPRAGTHESAGEDGAGKFIDGYSSSMIWNAYLREAGLSGVVTVSVGSGDVGRGYKTLLKAKFDPLPSGKILFAFGEDRANDMIRIAEEISKKLNRPDLKVVDPTDYEIFPREDFEFANQFRTALSRGESIIEFLPIEIQNEEMENKVYQAVRHGGFEKAPVGPLHPDYCDEVDELLNGEWGEDEEELL